MAGAKPGPTCRYRKPARVNDGTLPRSVAPRARPLGASGDSVAHWTLHQKLLTAARRAGPKLPVEMRAQFKALFTGTNLAITSGVLTVWGASHFVGAGEVVDAGLLAIGVATIGGQAFQAGRDLGQFLLIAGNARSDLELDIAANYLARAVITIGVATFAAIIMKLGRRGGRGAAPAEDGFWGANVETWLARLGKSKAPPLVRERLGTALKFFSERFAGKNASQVEGYLKGIDFSQAVKLIVLEPGAEVVAYGDPTRVGMFYTKAGTAVDRLGVTTTGRQFMRFRVKTKTTVLESKATGVADTWTSDAKTLASGGGLQYIVPDAATTLDRL